MSMQNTGYKTAEPGAEEAVLENVLKKVTPRKSDSRRLRGAAEKIIKQVEKSCKKLGVKARAVLVGSAARGTWLRDELDIDIFILFPENLMREELELQGMAVARDVAGKKGRERFAEHPYVTMEFKGFEVDLVPGYDVSDPSMIKSAVDRTPHHQKYVSGKLTPELESQVLLAKQFMTGIEVYGAEYTVQGFSGYLCELLVLRHGSFMEMVRAAAGWKPGVVIDIERSYQRESDPRGIFMGDPLIVIDPVDRGRNVAAAVSAQSFAVFVRACQDFLRAPTQKMFFPKPLKPFGPKELKRELGRRGTRILCVVFHPPDVAEDVLYPQLRRAERSIVMGLGQSGFQVLRSDVWSDGAAVILVELTVSKLSRVQTRVGPLVSLGAEDFISEHRGSKKRLAGPFVDGVGRVVFELERDETDARQALRRIMKTRPGFGKHLTEAAEKGYRILDGGELVELCRHGGFRDFVSRYLTSQLPWYR
jgi:tRNA nucleotidyltransferase (CCA-adding enzyme)